ncbi:hypothetical protein PPACK8108_LOCUS20496 [Phakopsora pachyrhizi]|uniref:Uncharacterized protein n=1 Tax=Phakopsora pachyrhizi TaxID=170000 RepID=A0AAV0BIF0_PHAPC|nr:hypothetical protein PPACK8108_LOCUS20496 [Phakopsora pachyrhizi]
MPYSLDSVTPQKRHMSLVPVAMPQPVFLIKLLLARTDKQWGRALSMQRDVKGFSNEIHTEELVESQTGPETLLELSRPVSE